MPISNPGTESRIFHSLPEKVQSAIRAYAESAELSTDVVIVFAIAHFLDLKSIPWDDRHKQNASGSILDELPASLRIETVNYAAEDELPPEFVVELAIAHFLDPDSMTFDDCQTQLQQDRLALLREVNCDRSLLAYSQSREV